MPRRITGSIVWTRVATVAALGLAQSSHAQSAATPYPRMAPIGQYLMDRTAEIALAKSAAPASVSDKAQILVLGPKGYETAIEGTNGFVCLVERSWQADFDDPEFWNPKIRGAGCFNPAAARSVVPAKVKRQQMILAGLSKAQVMDSIKAALDRGTLVAPAPGAMCYMMSKVAYLNDHGDMAHLMFFLPLTDDKVWPASGPTPPFFVDQNPVDRVTTLIIPTGHWSDGAPASTGAKG